MKRILLIVIGIVVCACLVSIQPQAGCGATSKQESHGDINVIGKVFNITDKHYQMDGNITVKDGGTLILKNVILEFLQDEYKKYHFTVDNGSKLIMENTYVFVTANATRPYLKFTMTVNDGSECFINNSTIAFPGWINVANSNLTLFNSIIKKVNLIPSGMSVNDNDDCPLLFFNTSNVVMINSRVENYYEDSGLPSALDLNPMIQNLIASDGSVVVVEYGETLTVNQLSSSELLRLPTNRLTAAMLEVTYTTEEYYNGTNFIEWARDGISYENTNIQPRNQNKTAEENYTEKYDLWLQGIQTVEEACNASIRFINNDIESDSNSSVSFDQIRIVVSYDKNIVLIDSSLYAFNTYLDVDFKPADEDPTLDGTQATRPITYLEDSSYDHNTLRALENSELYLYNVTVKDIYQPNSDPPFLTDSSSEAFIYRLLTVNVMDSIQMPLSDAVVNVFYYENKTQVEYPSDLVLACIGRTSQSYNQTNIYGNAIFPLLSDIISTKDWPNADFVGKYSINVSYKEYRISQNVNLTQFPLISAHDNSPVMPCVFAEFIPDLTPVIYLSTSTPTDGDTVNITATIYNNGTTNAYEIPVTFYDNDEIFDEKTIPVVNYSECIQISTDWTAHSTTPSELHNISVIVNPLDATDVILETNYENNEAYGLVTVYSRPDLSVENILFPNSFAVEGDEITVSASIINAGETDANVVIEFYKNCTRFNSSNIFVAANDSILANTSFTTAGEGGNVLINVKITNSTPEESNVLNNEKSASILVYAKHSMVLESEKVLPPSFTWKGYIIVKDEGSLILSNATLTMKENTENQCEIIVLNNGQLIVQNSIITSNANLKLYLYGNSVLTVINSTMILDVVGSGGVEISIQNSIINGTVDVGCKMFSAAEFNLTGDLKLNAITVNIENSFVNATNISISSSKLWANNTNLMSPLTFSMGDAYLINVIVPEIKPINATIHRYWWMNVDVTDSAGSALSNATINVYSTQTVPFELVASSSTDENGTAVIALSTDTNYLVNATYGNWSKEMYEYIENNTIITMVIPKIIIEPTSIIITIDEIPEVKAGETITVSGIVEYNIGSKPGIANITVTITIDGAQYTTTTDATGSYSRNITAPGTGGTYTITASVTDPEFNVQGSNQKTLSVQGPPAKPVDIIPIIIAIIIIVVVLIVCVIKRKLLKAYLIVLKAKVKKEEFTECSECSKKIPSASKKCPYCDTELGEEKEVTEEERAKCSECGALIPVTAKKCPKCGATFEE